MKLLRKSSSKNRLPLPKLPAGLSKVEVRKVCRAYAQPVRATECGHLAARIAVVWLGEESIITDMGSMPAPTYCGTCLASMAIRCAWCGRAIFIGDPVTLYFQSSGELHILPDRAVVYDQARKTLVGCLGRNCADTGADRAGFWMPDPENPGQGYVELHESLYSRAERDGVVIVEDISKP